MATGEPAPLPTTGDVIEDRYLLQEPLGEGGVGLVFRAQQLRVQREVAVKVLQNEALGEHAMRPRFEQEALTLATLAHPNIVRLQDYGLVAGRPYLVMDLVEGRTLQALMAAEGPLAPTRALSLMQQLAYALAYAHERGVVHRDLKPANLIINDLPHQPEQLTVLDFGFAKFLPGSALEHGAPVTGIGMAFGSPRYISPEQCAGGPVDGRADLYAAGIVLFEMLTGDTPYAGDTPDLLRHHLTTAIPRLSERRASLARYPELQSVVDALLAKSRDERVANAGALVAVLAATMKRVVAADDDNSSLDVTPRAQVANALGALWGAVVQLSRALQAVWRGVRQR
jgi:eukaryotic-like serine/threonine-protein kinase